MLTTNSPSASNGRCLCGDVVLTASGSALKTMLCTCKTCIKMSSSLGQVISVYSKDQVEIKDPHKRLVIYSDHHTESGKPKVGRFCSNCGLKMFAYVTVADVIGIRAGVFDEPHKMVPGTVQWTQSANANLNNKILELLELRPLSGY